MLGAVYSLAVKVKKIGDRFFSYYLCIAAWVSHVILGHFGEWALTKLALHTPEKINWNLKVLRVLYFIYREVLRDKGAREGLAK